MADIVLSVKGLKKSYGDLVAVNNLSLQVKRGEIFGLLGQNGAGKTTTIECILGTKSFDQGNISVLGMNPAKERKKLFAKVGVQFQQSSCQDKIKVKEVCQVSQSLYEKTLDWQELLQNFSLADKQNILVSELSGGERQKLSVLLACLHQPEIVFLDEVTTGLDPQARREVWKYIDLLRKEGVSVLLTSHYMDEVQFLCDRISILKKGFEVICDTPENVIKKSEQENLDAAYLHFTEMEVR